MAVLLFAQALPGVGARLVAGPQNPPRHPPRSPSRHPCPATFRSAARHRRNRRRAARHAAPAASAGALRSPAGTVGFRRGFPRRHGGRHALPGSAGRFHRNRHRTTRYGAQAAHGQEVPRRSARRKEFGFAGLRRTQQVGIHLQPGRRNLSEPQPQGRLHAHRHEHEADLRLRKARLGGRRVDGNETRVCRRRDLLQDGHDHLQPRFAEGQDQRAWRRSRATAGSRAAA